tara:strand:- start:85 stop:1245 length:1161 start_codon:yes stop_codon:yes gene_type:complete
MCLFQENELPQAIVPLHPKDITINQQYMVSTSLVLPESPVNQDIGMFMMELELMSGNISLTSVARPLVLHYKSQLLQWFQTIFYSLFYLLGFMEEKQTLSTHLLDDLLVDGVHVPTHFLLTLSAPLIQVYQVSLHLHAKLGLITYFMHKWFISSTIISVSVIIMVEWFFIILAAIIGFFLLRSHRFIRQHEQDAMESESVEDDDDENDGAGIAERSLAEEEHRRKKVTEKESMSENRNTSSFAKRGGPSSAKKPSPSPSRTYRPSSSTSLNSQLISSSGGVQERVGPSSPYLSSPISSASSSSSSSSISSSSSPHTSKQGGGVYVAPSILDNIYDQQDEPAKRDLLAPEDELEGELRHLLLSNLPFSPSTHPSIHPSTYRSTYLSP